MQWAVFYYWTNEMHRSPVEYATLTDHEIAAVWACMEIAIEESKRASKKAKSRAHRRS